jgi:hypothetical protein
LHSTLITNLDKRNTYVRMLFFDDSSAFNTCPSNLVTKLMTLGLNTCICNWVLDFLTGQPQVVMVGNNCLTSNLNTGPHRGVYLVRSCDSLFTHDSVATHDSNAFIKFTDDTPMVGLEVSDLSVGPEQQPLPQHQ